MGHEAWYVMEDGSVGDPAEVAHDKAGILRHRDGRAVAHAAHGPRTRSVDPDKERKAAAAAAAKAKDMRPGDRPAYSTREVRPERTRQ